MPIYKIVTEGEEKARLVKAASAPAAIAHCARTKFSATLVRSVEDAADMISDGVSIEKAGAADPGPKETAPPASE